MTSPVTKTAKTSKWLRLMCKSHYDNLPFTPTVTDPITKMEIAHTVGLGVVSKQEMSKVVCCYRKLDSKVSIGLV